MFSVEEVNKVIPEVESILNGLYSKKEDLNREHDAFFMEQLLNENGSHPKEYDPGRSLDRKAQELDDFAVKLKEDVERLQSLGCILRNLDKGWIDFLGERDGQKVFYCWRMGEKTIQYYHLVESNPTDRLPL